MSVDWLIVGGGIHGVHIAARLIGEAGVPASSLRIVDPNPQLLGSWRRLTGLTGMRYLRSPSVHHLDLDAWSLRKYSKKRPRTGVSQFAPPYDRPSLDLFNEHCDGVIQAYGLKELHVRARVQECFLEDQGVKVVLDNDEVLRAKQLVFAIGVTERPFRPDWVPVLPSPVPVQHIFDKSSPAMPSSAQRFAVVGGGITAGQVALALAGRGHQVDLVTRHDLREHQFDSDPGWLGPKHMNAFAQERCFEARRAMIRIARHRGSLPGDVARALRRAQGRKKLAMRKAEVSHLDPRQRTLELTNGKALAVDRVVLATGFSPGRPGGAMIDDLVEREGLPCAPCGFPAIGRDLRWSERIFVSGPLAELEIGPVSRNIAGARRSGDRLVDAARALL